MRQTGFARNTGRRWLRATPAGELGRVVSTAPGVETPTTADGAQHEPRPLALPPPPWESWAQVRQVKGDLFTDRFLFARRPEHLSDDDQARRHAFLSSPLGDDLRPVRAFLDDWSAIGRTLLCAPRARADVEDRYQDWRDTPAYVAYPPLRRVQTQVDVTQFDRLSAFLDHPGWEATNNGAERVGWAFRQTQAPHCTRRTPEAIDAALTAQAVLRKEAAERGTDAAAVRSTRGRASRQSMPVALAA